MSTVAAIGRVVAVAVDGPAHIVAAASVAEVLFPRVGADNTASIDVVALAQLQRAVGVAGGDGQRLAARFGIDDGQYRIRSHYGAVQQNTVPAIGKRVTLGEMHGALHRVARGDGDGRCLQRAYRCQCVVHLHVGDEDGTAVLKHLTECYIYSVAGIVGQ